MPHPAKTKLPEGNNVTLTKTAFKKHFKDGGKSVYLASIRFNELCTKQYFYGALKTILDSEQNEHVTILTVDKPQLANLEAETSESTDNAFEKFQKLLQLLEEKLEEWWFGKGEIGLACAAILLNEPFPGKDLYFKQSEITYQQVKADYLRRAFGDCKTVAKAIEKFNIEAAQKGIKCDIKLWDQWLALQPDYQTFNVDIIDHLYTLEDLQPEDSQKEKALTFNKLTPILIKKLQQKIPTETPNVVKGFIQDALDFTLRHSVAEFSNRKELLNQSITDIFPTHEEQLSFLKKIEASIKFLLLEARPLVQITHAQGYVRTIYPGSQYNSFIAIEEELITQGSIKKDWYELHFQVTQDSILASETQKKVGSIVKTDLTLPQRNSSPLFFFPSSSSSSSSSDTTTPDNSPDMYTLLNTILQKLTPEELTRLQNLTPEELTMLQKLTAQRGVLNP